MPLRPEGAPEGQARDAVITLGVQDVPYNNIAFVSDMGKHKGWKTWLKVDVHICPYEGI